MVGVGQRQERDDALQRQWRQAGADRLYATDFHNNRVDVFDASFNPVTTAPFKDPKLPKGYAPFGIQALAGSIFVTYAKQDAARKDDVAGNGFGYVDQY